MRACVLALALLLAFPCAVSADVLVDEWTAEFERGRKRGWEHEVIRETSAETGKGPGYVRTSESFRVVGADTIRTTTRVETDAKGMVRAYRNVRAGALGPAETTLAGRKYAISIRKLPKVEGELTADGYDLAILAALVRKGRLPEGEMTLPVLDLLSKRVRERTLEVQRAADGRWQQSREDGYEDLRAADGTLIHRIRKKWPFWSREPATRENAADRAVKGKAPPALLKGDRVEGATAAITHPGGDWILQRDTDGGVAMIGLDHPLEMAVMVIEFPIPFGDTEANQRAVVNVVRKKLNQESVDVGEPDAATFLGRPVMECAVGGVVDGQAVSGSAYFTANRSGGMVMLLGAHPADLRERCAPLLAFVMSHVKLDAVQPKVRWTRVEAKTTGLSFEIPEAWTRQGFAEEWVSKHKLGRVRVGARRLPEESTSAVLQDAWVAKLRAAPALVDVEVISVREREVAGREMRATRIACGVDVEGAESMRMTAVTLSMRRSDGVYVEIVVTTVAPAWKVDVIDRIIESVRWLSDESSKKK